MRRQNLFHTSRLHEWNESDSCVRIWYIVGFVAGGNSRPVRTLTPGLRQGEAGVVSPLVESGTSMRPARVVTKEWVLGQIGEAGARPGTSRGKGA
jgi:hypothetical protein